MPRCRRTIQREIDDMDRGLDQIEMRATDDTHTLAKDVFDMRERLKDLEKTVKRLQTA